MRRNRYDKSRIEKPTRTEQMEARTMKNGPRHTVYSVNGDQYTGEWKDNMRHGQGIELWKEQGVVYKGQLKDNMRHGQGTLTWLASGAEYVGEWKFGKYDGCGVYREPLLEQKKHCAKTLFTKYSGEFKNGMKHGYGTFFYKDSEVYQGEWSEGLRSGRGRMWWENGDTYDGEWLNDKCHGQGIMFFANGDWYEGSWENGERNGNGKFFYPQKGHFHEGFWVNNSPKYGTVHNLGGEDAPTPAKHQIPNTKDAEWPILAHLYGLSPPVCPVCLRDT